MNGQVDNLSTIVSSFKNPLLPIHKYYRSIYLIKYSVCNDFYSCPRETELSDFFWDNQSSNSKRRMLMLAADLGVLMLLWTNSS